MANVALDIQNGIKGVLDTPAAGEIGEVRAFTSRGVTAVTTGYTANATALDTLPEGVWSITWSMLISATTSATFIEAFISLNTTNDSSENADSNGFIIAGSTTGLSSGSWRLPGSTFVLPVAKGTTTPIYAKALSYGANRTVSLDGFAVRIA